MSRRLLAMFNVKQSAWLEEARGAHGGVVLLRWASAMLLAACTLAGCASTINMPLDHARLADGYVNSSTLDLGHVLV